MLSLSPVVAIAEGEPKCVAKFSRNCACVTEALKDTLGPGKTTFLVRVWVSGFDRNTARRNEFFRVNDAQVSDVVLQYAKHRDRITRKCGELDFDDDIY